MADFYNKYKNLDYDFIFSKPLDKQNIIKGQYFQSLAYTVISTIKQLESGIDKNALMFTCELKHDQKETTDVTQYTNKTK